MEINIKRKITFGKHRDKFIIDIINSEPFYIRWLLNNVKGFSLNEDEKILYNNTIDACKRLCRTNILIRRPQRQFSGMMSPNDYDEFKEDDDICLGVNPMTLFR